MLSIKVRGEGEFAKAGNRLRTGTRGAERSYTQAIVRGVKAQSTVKAAVPRYLPSGYAPVLVASLKVTAATRGSTVDIKASAPGRRGHPRRIDQMERGQLRHPKWPRGRRSTWKWHGQRIKAGFFTEPLAKRRKHIEGQIQKAMGVVADRCTRG